MGSEDSIRLSSVIERHRAPSVVRCNERSVDIWIFAYRNTTARWLQIFIYGDTTDHETLNPRVLDLCPLRPCLYRNGRDFRYYVRAIDRSVIAVQKIGVINLWHIRSIQHHQALRQ